MGFWDWLNKNNDNYGDYDEDYDDDDDDDDDEPYVQSAKGIINNFKKDFSKYKNIIEEEIDVLSDSDSIFDLEDKFNELREKITQKEFRWATIYGINEYFWKLKGYELFPIELVVYWCFSVII